MNCHLTRIYLDDYIAGQLSPSIADEMKEHLEHCPDCAALYNEEGKILTLLRSETVPDPGEKYWAELETTILNRTIAQTRSRTTVSSDEPKHLLRRAAGYLLPLAATVTLLLFSISFFGSPSRSLNISARWNDRRYYDVGVIGNHTFIELAGRPGESSETDLLNSLMLSTPGALPHDMLLIEQLTRLGWGQQ